jgi:glycosyltransferase involved in cell wall biosynthesis
MQVVFVSWRDLAHPQAGGSEFVVDRLATGLASRGHDVTLLAGKPTASRDYGVLATGGMYSQYARAPFEYVRWCRGADVVVDVENGIPFFAPFWRRGPVVCLVHHVHTDQWDMYFPWAVARLGYALEHHVMPLVYRHSEFVAVSPSTAGELVKIGVDASRISTVIMGCDQVDHVEGEASEPMFVALGRLVPHKRLDLLLEMWERVRPQTGGTLVLAGEGPERARLEAVAGDSVVFTGFVSDDEKRHLLDEAWLLVHPAHHEGWGTVIMEAAAVGTPTIGFDVVGVRDSVQDDDSGVLVRAPDEFVAAWTDLASNRDRRHRLASGARAWAGAHTWERATDEFERVLERAVATGRRGGARGRTACGGRRWRRASPTPPPPGG